MMRLTIIPSDNAVYVSGVAHELDLSACGVPANVHALQWYDTKGWIEFNDDGDPFTPNAPNLIIEELPGWAAACVAVYDAWTPPPPPEATEPKPTPTIPTTEFVGGV